jgi:hypothetical protein
MNRSNLSFWMTLTGTVCWGVCFWWMWRLSNKQNFLLDQLRDQGKRIEKLSRIEHDLIKEVHPQVNEIKEGMEEMIAAVKENAQDPPPASRTKRLWFGHRTTAGPGKSETASASLAGGEQDPNGQSGLPMAATRVEGRPSGR